MDLSVAVDAVSKNFERTFVYLIGQGDCGEDYDDNDVLTGNTQINLLSPPGFGAPEGKIVYSLGGSCPLSGTDATCDKNTFRYAIDSLGTERVIRQVIELLVRMRRAFVQAEAN